MSVCGKTTLIISNERTEDIMKIFEFLEDSGLLIEGVTETIEKRAKFLGAVLSSIVARLFQNMLAGNRDR